MLQHLKKLPCPYSARKYSDVHAFSRLLRVPFLLPARAWLLLVDKGSRGRSRRVKGRLVMWGKKRRLQGAGSGRALAAVTWRRHLSRVAGSEGIACRLGRASSYRAIAETRGVRALQSLVGRGKELLGTCDPMLFFLPSHLASLGCVWC